MSSLLIANIFSFITACFTAASSWTKDPHRTYMYQVWQCLVYAIAAYFFGVYSSILMMFFNAFRNYLVAVQKYTFRWMISCSIISLVAGLMINIHSSSHSIPGYISVFLTVTYTITSFYLKDAKAVKINVAINLSMWFIYDMMILDIPSGTMDIISASLAFITLWRIRRDEIQSSKQ